MAKFFKYPFAIAGDRAPVPNPIQGDGSVSYEQGYPIDYQKQLGGDSNAKAILRNQYNEIMYDVTTALQQYQILGFPDFITALDNEGVAYPYATNAIVRYNNIIYQSIKNANTDLPTTVGSWIIISGIPRAAKVLKTSSQTITQAGVIVTFQTTDFDADGIWDGVSFKPIVPGIYQFYALLVSTSFPSINPNKMEISLVLNGVTYIKMDVETVQAADEAVGGMVQVEINGTTDYAQIFANMSSGTMSVGFQSYFGCSFVSPL